MPGEPEINPRQVLRQRELEIAAKRSAMANFTGRPAASRLDQGHPSCAPPRPTGERLGQMTPDLRAATFRRRRGVPLVPTGLRSQKSYAPEWPGQMAPASRERQCAMVRRGARVGDRTPRSGTPVIATASGERLPEHRWTRRLPSPACALGGIDQTLQVMKLFRWCRGHTLRQPIFDGGIDGGGEYEQ